MSTWSSNGWRRSQPQGWSHPRKFYTQVSLQHLPHVLSGRDCDLKVTLTVLFHPKDTRRGVVSRPETGYSVLCRQGWKSWTVLQGREEEMSRQG